MASGSWSQKEAKVKIGSEGLRELGLEGSSSGSDHKLIGLNEKEAKVRFCGLAKERKARNMG